MESGWKEQFADAPDVLKARPDQKTVVRAAGVAIGDGDFVTMAGPCSVETERQLMETAEFVARAGARVLLYGPGMMHSKGVIVDDRIGLIGSANFDLRSLFVNFEIGMIVYSESDIRAMQAWAAELIEHCHKPRAERSNRYRHVRSLAEEVSRLLAPLL